MKNNKGYQVKFGKGIVMNVDAELGRAIILICDNGEQDVVTILEAINKSQTQKATLRLTKAQEAFNRVVTAQEPKKTFWQRLFRK